MSERLGPVWSYWEGPCPPLIELCLRTLAERGGATILDRRGFDELWCSDRDLPIDELYVVHRADFVRAHLLRHYGGVWIDADCILLKSLQPLLAEMGESDLGYFCQKVGGIANNFIAARKAAPVVRDYYERVVSHLRERRPIDWIELGTIPLTQAIETYPRRTHAFERRAIMPVCWSESSRFCEPFTEPPDGATVVDARATCYMLSNHSLPAELRLQAHSELVCAPNLLGAVLRRALTKEAAVKANDESGPETAANYAYWRDCGSVWDAEYERRRNRHPFYHIAELMLVDYVAHHAPCRVLEWGCGTGRHLYNLSQLEGVEVFGFDQSEAMVESGIGRSLPEFRRERVTIGPASGKLPYGDRSFDLVVTSEALLHTRPEDLEGRLLELIRVTRGHVLHLESPPSWIGGFSAWHDGCWGHDLVGAYRALGVSCEVMGSGFTRQVPYRALVSEESVRWSWSEAMLSVYRRMEASLEEGFRAAGVSALA